MAHANLIALEHPQADGIALNVGGGRGITVDEFARIMIDASGSEVDPEVPGEFRLGDTRHTVSDLTRMRALGWEPTVPVEENVRQYLDWLDTQVDTTEYLLEADRVMAEQGIVRRSLL